MWETLPGADTTRSPEACAILRNRVYDIVGSEGLYLKDDLKAELLVLGGGSS